MAAQQKTIEFGVLVKEQLVYMGNEKIDPSSNYCSGWDQLDKSKNYIFKKKDFSDEYQGTVKPLLVFNTKPAKEAYKRNVNAKWDMHANGSRAGVSKIVYSSTINDGADEEEIVASLKKSGITVGKLTCDDNDKDIASYQTGIMFKVFKLTLKGYAPKILVIAGDVAAQHISLNISITPNTSEFLKACR
jgi:hypothetical protein